MITIRIPPLSKKKDIYYDGRPQTDDDRKGELKYSSKTIPLAALAIHLFF